MQLELTHSNRLGQFANMTWNRFVERYLFGRYATEKDRVYKELCETGKSKLTDEDGTLYIEVVK